MKNNRTILWIAALLLLPAAIILLFPRGKKQEATDELAPVLAVGDALPELALPTPDSTLVSLSDFKGQYLILDFWASWCPDCRAEFDAVKDLYARCHDRGVEILGISFDTDGDAWKACLEEQDFPWPQVSNLIKWKENPVNDAIGIRWIPTMLLADPEGKVLGYALKAEEMEILLNQFLP